MRLAYVHLARFPVQRRVIEQPALSGKPFVLAEHDRGVRRVAFASSTALRGGIRPGMTVTAACARLPGLVHFDYQPEAEEAALSSLGEALLAIGPAFQRCAPEGLWLEASAAHLFGGEAGLAKRVIEVCAEHGYRARVAVASEPFTARAVARHSGDRVRVIAAEESAKALAPLPLGALELEGDSVSGELGALGLTTLGEIATLPVGAVIARLGASGRNAIRLCRGEDDSAFVPAVLPEEIEEGLQLEWPAEALDPVLFALKTCLDRIASRLRGRQRAAVKLTIRFRLDPSGTCEIPLTLSRPTSHPKLLLDLTKHRLSEVTVQNPIAGVWVHVDEASEDRGQQLGLGDQPEGDASLEVVLARLTSTLGEEALFAAEIEGVHRPESAYAKKTFRPPPRERGLLAELTRSPPLPLGEGRVREERPTGPRLVKAESSSEAQASRTEPPLALSPLETRPIPAEAGRSTAVRRSKPAAPPKLAPADDPALLERPSRLFTQPAHLDADLGAEGELVSARLLGKRRRVVALAGPERLCGEWWETSAYSRDYYRVHFEGIGPVWVFRDGRDGRFYLQGMFD